MQKKTGTKNFNCTVSNGAVTSPDTLPLTVYGLTCDSEFSVKDSVSTPFFKYLPFEIVDTPPQCIHC